MNVPQGSEDSDLIRRAVEEDQSALRELFGRYHQRLRRMIAVRLDPALAARVDPSDVVQDSLMEATRKLPDYCSKPSIPFYPWLRKIAWERLVHIHIRHLAAQRRSVRREAHWEPELSDASVLEFADQFAASQTSPSRGLVRKELESRVRDALDELEANDREILVLRYLEGLSIEEIAAILEISTAAASMRQLRALERMRGLMADPFEE
jgi:RNA polymerase sigma-70 factor (ECF subfamily)